MQSKILKVFYGEDCLPYKDQEKTVHFPITGNAFQGASQTTEIRFYIKDIGGEDLTWVANAKLPNGRIIPKILTVLNDPELEEDYALLQLTSVYTQAKGDLYISLQGYDGDEIEMEYDGYLYQLSGNPTIQATGSIKLTIAYATPLYVGDEVEEITLQEILAYFNTKLNIGSSAYIKCVNIVNIENHVFSTEDGYNAGDIIYNKQDKKFGRLQTINSQLRFQIADIVVGELSIDDGDHRFNFYAEHYQDPILIIEEDESGKELGFDFAEDDIYFTGSPNVKFLKERTIEISTYTPTHSVELTTTQYNIISKQPSYIYWKKSDNPIKNCYYIFANEDSSYIYFKPLNVPDKFESGGVYRLEGTYLRVNKTTRLCEEQSNTLVVYSSQQADNIFAKKINITRLSDTAETEYVYRFSLLNENNETISYKDLDLPLESIVQSGEYDSETQSIILTLDDGTTITIPVGDLVSGLVSTSDLEVAISGCVAKKTTSGLHAYTHNGETEGEVAITSDKGANTIVQRDSLGDIYVGTDSASKVATETYVNTQNLLNEKLANKVTSLSSSSTDTQYPSAKAVYDNLQNVRSVAEGKCEVYMLSHNATQGSYSSEIYYLNENNELVRFANNTELTSWLTGKTLINSIFNSTDNYITTTASQTNYFIINKTITSGGVATLLITANQLWKKLHLGDIFLITNTDVPDRWYSGGYQSGPSVYIRFHELEVDLHNMVTTDTNQDITGSKTFKADQYIGYDKKLYFYQYGSVASWIRASGSTIVIGNLHSGNIADRYFLNADYIRPATDGTQDLGTSTYKWKDLYIAGNISNGTQSFTVLKAYNILNSVTDTTTDTLSFEKIIKESITADKTYSVPAREFGTEPECRAIITNSGSSTITLTFNDVSTCICNDDSVTITSTFNSLLNIWTTTITMPANATYEISIVDGKMVAINWNAQ